MYFPVSVPTRISTDPGHGTRIVSGNCPFLLSLPMLSPGQWRPSCCVFLLLPKSPSGPPWNEGHWPKVRHETSVFEVPAQEQHEHSFTLVLLIHLLHVLCTWYAGIAHHRALQTSGRGWAGSKAVHRMECSGARSLYWRSLSAGAAA